MTTCNSAHVKLEGNSLISSLSPLVKSNEEEIQSSSYCVDTTRLDTWTTSRTFLNNSWRYRFWPLLADRIINSWWLDILNFLFNVFYFLLSWLKFQEFIEPHIPKNCGMQTRGDNSISRSCKKAMITLRSKYLLLIAEYVIENDWIFHEHLVDVHGRISKVWEDIRNYSHL